MQNFSSYIYNLQRTPLTENEIEIDNETETEVEVEVEMEVEIEIEMDNEKSLCSHRVTG